MFWDTFPIMLIMHFHKIRRLCTSKSNYANQVLILKPQKVWRRENNVWRVKFLLLHNCILLSEWQDVWENNVLQKQYFDIWRQSAVCPSEQRLWCLVWPPPPRAITSPQHGLSLMGREGWKSLKNITITITTTSSPSQEIKSKAFNGPVSTSQDTHLTSPHRGII